MTPVFLSLALLTTPARAGAGQITLLITNATEVAKKEKGAAVVTVAGMFMDIDLKTQKVIAKRMGESLEAQGLHAVVEPATIQFPSPGYSSFTMWDPAAQSLVPVTLALGEYRVLQVDILNPDDVVARQTSSMVVDVAHLVGWDLKGEVNERAAPLLLQELDKQGIRAVAAW